MPRPKIVYELWADDSDAERHATYFGTFREARDAVKFYGFEEWQISRCTIGADLRGRLLYAHLLNGEGWQSDSVIVDQSK